MSFSFEDLVSELYHLPTTWKWQSLESLLQVGRGISYGIVQPGKHKPDGVPMIRVNNIGGGRISTSEIRRVDPKIESKYKRTRLQGGEVLLSLVGSIGEVAIVPPTLSGWNTARAVAVIPVDAEIGNQWLAYCLRSPTLQHYIHTWATTTVQATLNLRDVAVVLNK